MPTHHVTNGAVTFSLITVLVVSYYCVLFSS